MEMISKAIVDGSLDAISEERRVKLEALERSRHEQVKEEFGHTARVVEPYEPNRKQRRAQAHMARVTKNRSKK